MSEASDRIYGWLDSYLSLARHYGGINIQGVAYVLDDTYTGHPNKAPLVKEAVLIAEKKAAKLSKQEKIQQETSLF